MKEYSYTESGRIKFIDKHDDNSSTNGIIKNAEEQALIDSGVDIAPYVAPIKTNDQLIAEIDLELTSLDATPRMLSGALLGDQYSIDKLKDIELQQAALRDKRKALL